MISLFWSASALRSPPSSPFSGQQALWEIISPASALDLSPSSPLVSKRWRSPHLLFLVILEGSLFIWSASALEGLLHNLLFCQQSTLEVSSIMEVSFISWSASALEVSSTNLSLLITPAVLRSSADLFRPGIAIHLFSSILYRGASPLSRIRLRFEQTVKFPRLFQKRCNCKLAILRTSCYTNSIP